VVPADDHLGARVTQALPMGLGRSSLSFK
jgi:hypothetical protein